MDKKGFLEEMMLKKEFSLLIFSLIVGILVGGLEVIFGKVLLIVTEWRLSYFTYLIFLLPLIGLLIPFLYNRFGGKSKEGMSLIFKVGQGEEDDIPLVLIPLVVVTTWLTHLFGGSAGREGVAVQIGGAFSHWFSKRSIFSFLNQEEFGKTAVVIGMAAGFSGLFQTPLAATFFALEVLVVGRLEMRTIIYTGIAAYSAYFVSSGLDLEKTSFVVESTLNLTPILVVELLILGLIFGLTGTVFATSLKQAKLFFQKKLPNVYQRIFIGGVLVAVLIFFLHEGRYAGLGTNLITASFTDGTIYSYDFVLKLLLTVLTLAIGFQGGEVTPLFAIGSALGVILAPVFGLPIGIVAALGYVAVFGSATNTFLAPILIGGEVFGFDLLPLFFITMLAAYHINFNHSIYGNQKGIDDSL